jgi:hypothetical protein
VLDVGHGLLEKLADVLVVQLIDDPTALALSGDKPKVAQDAQLVGDRGGLHFDRLGKLAHRARPLI